MPTYSEKLKDPRWQKKRLQILERDNWTCTACGDMRSTLAVHHFYYERGKDPWDYPDDALATLCEDCHEREGFERPQAEATLLSTLRRREFTSNHIIDLAYGFSVMHFTHWPWTIILVIRQFLIDPIFQEQVIELFKSGGKEKNHG